MKNKSNLFKVMMGVFLFFTLTVCFLYAAPKSTINPKAKSNVATNPTQYVLQLPDLVVTGQEFPPYPFCSIDSQGKLVILVKNQGRTDAPASSTIVEFRGGNSVVLPTPPIPKNTLVPLQPISIPNACYQSYKNYDCDFDIKLDVNKQIAELNENNNISAGKCTPPGRLDVKLGGGTEPGDFIGSFGKAGKCPMTVYFTGRITASSMRVIPLTIKYQFVRSNGTSGPVQSLVFNALGTQEVSESRVISQTMDINGEWEQLKVIDPLYVDSNKVTFRVTCSR